MSIIDRLGALAGIGAAAYFMFLPVPTSEVSMSPEDPSAQIAEKLAGNSGPARLGALLGLIAVVLLMMFFSRLHGALQQTSTPSSWLPTMAMTGGVLLASVLLLEIGVAYASSELISEGQDTQVAKFFVLWDWNSATLFAPGFAITIIATTLVAWTEDGAPEWYRWVSAASLVLLLLISGVMRAPGLAIAPGMLWMFATSLMLAIQPKSTPTTAL